MEKSPGECLILFLIKFDKIFAMIAEEKILIEQIVKEAEQLGLLEQQILLTRLRVKRLSEKGTGNIANPPKNLKAPSMKQIDKWKHEARKKL